MQTINSPKSNYPILEGAELNFVTTSDGCKVRFALWPKGRKGLIVFFNGRNEYLEKYNENRTTVKIANKVIFGKSITTFL